MRQFLHHDSESRALLLVMTDLYNGQHERTEFHVMGDDGPLRNQPAFDGVPVTRSGGQWVAVVREPYRRDIPFRIDPAERSDTERTPCRRLASKSGRAKCELCAVSS